MKAEYKVIFYCKVSRNIYLIFRENTSTKSIYTLTTNAKIGTVTDEIVSTGIDKAAHKFIVLRFDNKRLKVIE